MKYERLTHAIIGCAMQVHNTLGRGFPEKMYQRALGEALRESSLKFRTEYPMQVYYHDRVIGSRRVDMLVEDSIIVELKAQWCLTNAHLAQAINYLEIHQKEIGLLLNFGSPRLQFRRVYKKDGGHTTVLHPNST